MEYYHILGGKMLYGEVEIQGAKNAVLPILAATLAGRGESYIFNCPQISDVEKMLNILQSLGCVCKRDGSTVSVNSTTITSCKIERNQMESMRSSVFLTGILLGIKGEVELSMPGGCKIGKRPIDLHLKALKTLGAEIEEKGEVIRCVSPKLKGAEVYFDFPSVGATENAMMAAIFAEGTTVLKNCAKEPEIEDLASFLIKCGACIKGAGTETIYIKGSKNYHSTEHTVIPDRIEGGTFLSFAATAGGKIAIKNIIPTHMKNITDAFKSMGANIKVYENSLEINRKERLKPLNIRTGIYPEFPTDMQSPLVSALCFADGVSIVKEEIFENRFNFINQLKFMKAIVEIRGKNAIINGVSQIFGAKVFAEDLRGGAALVTAALGALGETDIFGIDHIERGYEQLCYKLNCLEADIEKRS